MVKDEKRRRKIWSRTCLQKEVGKQKEGGWTGGRGASYAIFDDELDVEA